MDKLAEIKADRKTMCGNLEGDQGLCRDWGERWWGEDECGDNIGARNGAFGF